MIPSLINPMNKIAKETVQNTLNFCQRKDVAKFTCTSKPFKDTFNIRCWFSSLTYENQLNHIENILQQHYPHPDNPQHLYDQMTLKRPISTSDFEKLLTTAVSNDDLGFCAFLNGKATNYNAQAIQNAFILSVKEDCSTGLIRFLGEQGWAGVIEVYNQAIEIATIEGYYNATEELLCSFGPVFTNLTNLYHRACEDGHEDIAELLELHVDDTLSPDEAIIDPRDYM